MPTYLYVVTAGLKEVGRTVCYREAAKLLVTRVKALVDGGYSGSVIGACWITGYRLPEGEDVQQALGPAIDPRRYHWAGLDSYQHVINQSHKSGWIRDGEWVDSPPVPA